MAKIDDSVKKKVPKLRFKGFTDEWEERKFKDNIVSIQTGTNLLGSEFNEGTPLIKMGNLQRGYFSFKKLEYLELNSNVELEDIINYGDFLFNTRNTLELVGKGATWTGISGKYAFNSNIARFKFDGIDTIFFNYLYNTQPVISQVHARAVGTTSVAAVYPRDLNSLLYYLPSIEEQQKIGSFFKQLDDTIALHQRKLDLLKEQKKGYLQKMFPKNGAKVPELRFAGFADDWEERKAKDLFIPVNERNREDLPVLSVTQNQGVVFRNDLAIDIKYDESTLSSYKVIHPGDFVISLRSFQGGFELSNVLGISSPAYTIFDFAVPAEQDKLYWKAIFKTFKFIESLKTVTFGIRDGKSISFKEFGDLKLNYPSDVDEQRQIGSFFKQLDETIALHQRKLDLLKEQKKGFLQKIFV